MTVSRTSSTPSIICHCSTNVRQPLTMYAKPLKQWRTTWPSVYEQALSSLRRQWPEGRGVREFVQVLQLHTTYPADLLEQAIALALSFGCVHYEGVRLCLNQLLMPTQLPLPLALDGTTLAQFQAS